MGRCSIASKKFPKQREVLLRSTLYTSTEPCAMCAGAIFWTGIGRVVFGCSVPKLNESESLYRHMCVYVYVCMCYLIYNIVKSRANISADKALTTQCREVFAQGKGHEVKVTGPVIEDEAVRVHEGYWGSAEMEEQIRRMLERQKEGATE